MLFGQKQVNVGYIHSGCATLALDVAGVERAHWLEQQGVHLLLGHRPMFDAMGDDEELALGQCHGVFAKLDVQPTAFRKFINSSSGSAGACACRFDLPMPSV